MSLTKSCTVNKENSVGDDRIFLNGMKENERIAGANSVGDDRIFRNEMEENEGKCYWYRME